jgi:cell wall-associated NlpC family hydrolase
MRMSSRGNRAAPSAIACLLAAAGLAACGEAKVGSPTVSAKAPAAGVVASAVAGAGAPKASTATGTIKEVADPQEASSYPAASGSIHNPAAATPAKAGETIVAAGAPSNAEIKRELQLMQAAESKAKRAQKSQLTPVSGGESSGGDGALPIPTNVPEVVQKVIAGANEITDFPYVFGGGHASFVDNAYDCSGSVSYALAAGGLLSAPEVSGTLESWGAP